ncbi:Rieske (2Fe-2S) protein [Paenibacillus solisilvae]|uniref:Rieske (2Fe-2S) protein n=1 Tax=Paenibacillus solisilvae TaxID=2486751 RepID=A0ABW0W5S8_9BACL
MSSISDPSSRVIGKVEDYNQFPAAVNVDNDPYFIVHSNSRAKGETPVYKLVSAICPHAGGTVRPLEDELICPLHYWSFDASTGESTNVPGEQLDCQPLAIQDGYFVLQASS